MFDHRLEYPVHIGGERRLETEVRVLRRAAACNRGGVSVTVGESVNANVVDSDSGEGRVRRVGPLHRPLAGGLMREAHHGHVRDVVGRGGV